MAAKHAATRGLRSLGVVLCNGRQVIDQVRAARLADLRDAGVIRHGAVPCRLNEGTAASAPVRWLAWSTNLQSSWGLAPN
jgi:hypothetical protein